MHGEYANATEADRWIALYTELVSSTENALRQARVANLTQTAEMQLIQAHLGNLKDRLAFWRIRRGREQLRGRLAVEALPLSRPETAERSPDGRGSTVTTPAAGPSWVRGPHELESGGTAGAREPVTYGPGTRPESG
jgi:hypothetical protein